MGIDTTNMKDKEGASACIEAIKSLSKSINIRSRIKELGAKEEVLATNALKDACGLTNPKQATHEEIKQIFKNSL